MLCYAIYQRSGDGDAVQIDDSLLRAAHDSSKQFRATPKPWEPEWAAYVKDLQAQVLYSCCSLFCML